MKKNLKLLLVLFATGIFFASCHNNNTTLLGDFATRASFQGLGRNGAVVFVIGNQAFVGTGYNKDNNKWLNDFWVYDAVKNNWAMVAPFPGLGRVNAVALSAGGKGYVGTGYSNTGGANTNLKDFYSFDPTAGPTGTWTKVADLPGPTRRGAVAFSANNTGYVGTGVSFDTTGVTNGLGDFYAYAPATNTWKAVAGYPGLKVNGAFSFVINNQVYVGGGSASGINFDNELFQYNPTADIWYKKARLDSNLSGVQRAYCASFATNGYGYVVSGSGSQSNYTFEYNPGNDTWNQKANWEGSYRFDCIGFAIPGLSSGYTGFIGLGTPGASSTPNYDFWGFNPKATTILNN